jgi:hypothetical protein
MNDNPAGSADQQLLIDVNRFIEQGLRAHTTLYQQGVAQAVLQSVLQGAGSLVCGILPANPARTNCKPNSKPTCSTMFSETNAELRQDFPYLEAPILQRHAPAERVLSSNLLVRKVWARSRVISTVWFRSSLFLLRPAALQYRGRHRFALLEVDEAQDVLISKVRKRSPLWLPPTNATRSLLGHLPGPPAPF